jgi:hypothetical protein
MAVPVKKIRSSSAHKQGVSISQLQPVGSININFKIKLWGKNWCGFLYEKLGYQSPESGLVNFVRNVTFTILVNKIIPSHTKVGSRLFYF